MVIDASETLDATGLRDGIQAMEHLLAVAQRDDTPTENILAELTKLRALHRECVTGKPPDISQTSIRDIPRIGAGLCNLSAREVLNVLEQFAEATENGQRHVDEVISHIGIPRTVLFELMALTDKIEIAARNNVPVWGPKGINPVLRRLRAGISIAVHPTPKQSNGTPQEPYESNGHDVPQNEDESPAAEPMMIPAEEAHLAFLLEIRGACDRVSTRLVSVAQRGMILDYYATLGYGMKSEFLRRYGIPKEVLPQWKNQVKTFRARAAVAASVASEENDVDLDDDVDDDTDSEDVQEFADGDRASFVRAYGQYTPRSVFDALYKGIHDYVPTLDAGNFRPTDYLPGSSGKLDVLAERAQAGLPLWHPQDRRSFNDGERD